MWSKLLVASLLVTLTSHAIWAAPPATVDEAAKVLDLGTLPLPPGADVPGHRRVAELGYSVKMKVSDLYAFVDKQLTESGFEQLPDHQIHPTMVTANYECDDFIVHLSIFPRDAEMASVRLSHMGNVPLDEVPVPSNAEKLYAFTNIVMYKSPLSVRETTTACRDAMLADGWSPYGSASDVSYFRRNAVQIDVQVASAPAQDNATMISVTSKLLSLQIPAPSFTDNFRYSDGTTAVDFDTDHSHQQVADFYREKLSPNGWKATTEQPVTIKWKQYTIFTNQAQQRITIATHEFEGRTRVHLDHQSASEVAEEELRGSISDGEKAKYRDSEWIPVEVEIPGVWETEQLEDWALKVRMPGGDAFSAATAVAKSLITRGWSVKSRNVDGNIIRSARLSGRDRTVHIIAIMPPKLDPWIAIVGLGGVKLTATNR